MPLYVNSDINHLKIWGWDLCVLQYAFQSFNLLRHCVYCDPAFMMMIDFIEKNKQKRDTLPFEVNLVTRGGHDTRDFLYLKS